MNELRTIDVMNKYNMGPILKRFNIKVAYGEVFMARPDINTIIVPEVIDEQKVDDYAYRIAPFVNEIHGIELNINNPDEACMFAILHEIGHIIDWRKHDEDIYNASYTIRKRRLEKLGEKISKRLNRIATISDKVWDLHEATYESIGKVGKAINKICSKIGNKLMNLEDKLADEVDKRYRQIPQEKRADEFAVKNLYEVLSGARTITITC